MYLRRPGEITRVKLSTRQRMLPAARGVWGRFGSLEPQLTPVQSWETDSLRSKAEGSHRVAGPLLLCASAQRKPTLAAAAKLGERECHRFS